MASWLNRNYDTTVEVHSHGPSPVVIAYDDETGDENDSNALPEDPPEEGAYRRQPVGSFQMEANSPHQGLPATENEIDNAGACSCLGASFHEEHGKPHLLEEQWERSNSWTSSSVVSLEHARGMTSIRDGESSVDDATKYDESKCNMRRFVLLCFLVILLASFIATMVTLVQRNKAESFNSIFGDDDILIYTSPESLADESSPQFMAWSWLTIEDAAGVTLENGNSTSEIQERFAAATLYFATGGDNWVSHLNFLSEESICNWNDGNSTGIFCEDGTGRVTTINIGKLARRKQTCFFIRPSHHLTNSVLIPPVLCKKISRK
jgi:hypothetical protein